MWPDIRYALRQIGRNKLFSLAIVLLLALGIGANGLIFSFINELLLKPLPVRDPTSLLMLEKNRQKQVRPDTEFFYSQVEDLARRKDLFSSVIAEESLEGRTHSVFLPFTSGDTTRLIATEIVSPNYFSDLGIHAVLGRVLTEADAKSSSQIPVILSYQFWQSQFNGQRSVRGKMVRIKDYPFVVVGVLPREFHSLDIDRAPDVRFPIPAAFALTGHSIWELKQRGFLGFHVVARLAPGVTQAQAAAAILPSLQASSEVLWREWYLARPSPPTRENLEDSLKFEREFRLDWQPAGYGLSELRAKFSKALILLMCGVGLLFLVVCANIVGLAFTKSEERRKEIAVRLSMGASRVRLVRQLQTENLILAIPGALLGTVLALYVFSRSSRFAAAGHRLRRLQNAASSNGGTRSPRVILHHCPLSPERVARRHGSSVAWNTAQFKRRVEGERQGGDWHATGFASDCFSGGVRGCASSGSGSDAGNLLELGACQSRFRPGTCR
ncbi:MAG: ABC transporter permease [Bryobacteraceae bacterium]